MIRRLFQFLLVASVISLFAFSNPKRAALISLFDNSGVIKLTKLEFVDNDPIKDPIGLTYYKDHLITVDYSRSNKFLTLVNLKDKTITHQISRGRGTSHLLYPRPLREDYIENCLSVFDNELRKTIYYDLVDSKLVEKEIKNELYKKKENLIGQLVRIDSTRVLLDGIFKGRDEKFQIRDLESGVSSYFGKHSDFKSEDNLTSGECFIAMQGVMAARPDSQMAVYASFEGGVIDFIDLSKDSIEINRKEYFIPKVEILSSKQKRFSVRPFQLGKGAIYGFIDVQVTQDHVYLLFSGNEIIPCGTKPDETCKKNRQNPTLLQFDWKGNPLNRWEFDRDIRSFAINPETSQIYVLAKDSSNTLLKGIIE